MTGGRRSEQDYEIDVKLCAFTASEMQGECDVPSL